MTRFNTSGAGNVPEGSPSSSPTPIDQPTDKKPVSEGPGVAPLPEQAPAKDEPDMVLEPDIPSDGPDEEGEAMIRDLPKRNQSP